VDAQTWFTAIGSQSGLPQYYTYSATNIRLQEAAIGYTLPRKWLHDVCNIQLSVVGRNLCMIYNKAPFDPEAVATTLKRWRIPVIIIKALITSCCRVPVMSV
jgi:hypothetical protein